MEKVIGWVVGLLIVGLVFWVVNKLWPMEGNFALVFRVMAGIIALVCFIGFLLALLKYAGIPTPF
jgi:hypothetical protein